MLGKIGDHMRTETPPDIVEDTVIHEEQVPAMAAKTGAGSATNAAVVKKGIKRRKVAADSRATRTVLEYEVRLLTLVINPPRAAAAAELERVIEID